jgi:membrane protein DedA with SNARE-associated domain
MMRLWKNQWFQTAITMAVAFAAIQWWNTGNMSDDELLRITYVLLALMAVGLVFAYRRDRRERRETRKG